MLCFQGKAIRDLVLTTPTVVLSGSFNPLHKAHIELATRASQLVGVQDFVFELAVKNADKGGITEADLMSRLAPFEAQGMPVMVTDSPLFIEKIKHFQK
jgi:phosphopantetheine adenylyltransferase